MKAPLNMSLVESKAEIWRAIITTDWRPRPSLSCVCIVVNHALHDSRLPRCSATLIRAWNRTEYQNRPPLRRFRGTGMEFHNMFLGRL